MLKHIIPRSSPASSSTSWRPKGPLWIQRWHWMQSHQCQRLQSMLPHPSLLLLQPDKTQPAFSQCSSGSPLGQHSHVLMFTIQSWSSTWDKVVLSANPRISCQARAWMLVFYFLTILLVSACFSLIQKVSVFNSLLGNEIHLLSCCLILSIMSKWRCS